jgi:hypothetical protein
MCPRVECFVNKSDILDAKGLVKKFARVTKSCATQTNKFTYQSPNAKLNSISDIECRTGIIKTSSCQDANRSSVVKRSPW